MPSLDRLEADGVKTVPQTPGHAILLMHDLMTLREMRHAIKHGHPERMERMLKYWAPMLMFWRGKSRVATTTTKAIRAAAIAKAEGEEAPDEKPAKKKRGRPPKNKAAPELSTLAPSSEPEPAEDVE
ncbi:hypothetical protein DFH08DRAFT_968479 [Mycena albidolilacea]|uniref:DUF6589 domain-containing protein n=1 Tax=Mycena albidolilacea TaxID=1033008 RepID=A0AAD7EHJ9_9AGAR|nr:hypothetical protein DFH08DRAFT_968479 [Mycena albidolilacea]